MGTCVTHIQHEITPDDIDTSKQFNASSVSLLSQRDTEPIYQLKDDHDSSSDEVEQNFLSVTKTDHNINIKYDLSTEIEDITLTKYDKAKTIPTQRVRDSLLVSPSAIDQQQRGHLDDINRFDETLLFGFIGDIETESKLIPMEICKVILIYCSHFIGSVFNQSKCSQSIHISNTLRNTLHKTDNEYGYYSAYHSVWIESESSVVIIYDVSVTFERPTSIYLGFVASDDILEDGFWWNTSDYSYAVSIAGNKYLNGNLIEGLDTLEIRSGDNIEVKLDLINDEISVNDLIIYQNIKKRDSIQYKFAIGFSWNANKHDSITINNIQHYGV